MASYQALTAARMHVPKVWEMLFLGDGSNNDAVAAAVGMAWGAARQDVEVEAARGAMMCVVSLLKAGAGVQVTCCATGCR